MIFACGDQTFFKVDESILTGAMLPKINVVADKSTIRECMFYFKLVLLKLISNLIKTFPVLIPQISMSFNCLSINRRDGSCIAHAAGQVNFAKIIQNNINAVSQLASDKCNQNVEAVQHHSILERVGHGSSMVDRMSQSVYDTCHQIFDEQENLQFSEHHHHRPIQKRKKNELPAGTKYDKVLPQLAFEMDSFYGVLWVFDAVEKKCSLYNVIGSEMPRNQDYSSHVQAILKPELTLPKKSEMLITRNLASINLLACLDILTSVPDQIASCFEQTSKPAGSLMKDSINLSDFQTVNRFENFGGGWGYSSHSVEAIRFMADTDVVLGMEFKKKKNSLEYLKVALICSGLRNVWGPRGIYLSN